MEYRKLRNVLLVIVGLVHGSQVFAQTNLPKIPPIQLPGLDWKWRNGRCGAEENFPLNPKTLEPVCPPYDRAAVFFAPHADDETLGMAGAILRQKKLGKSVFLELMTVGGDDGWLCTLDHLHNLAGVGPVHPGPYVNCPGRAGIRAGRIAEFLDAAERLGVTGVRIHNFEDSWLKSEDVSKSALFWLKKSGSNLQFYGTAGLQEMKPHSDHVAVYRGLESLKLSNTSWYYVYRYRDLDAKYADPLIVPEGAEVLSAEDCAIKRNALDSYRVWNPRDGRFGYGWLHSAGALFEQTYQKCYELPVQPIQSQNIEIKIDSIKTNSKARTNNRLAP